jgi:acylglycerol lipase
VVALLHGLGEHAGRYGPWAERFVTEGHAVEAIDLRGHGRSDGARGDTRFAPAMEDIDRLLAHCAGRHPATPIFLYGHSLGALLTLDYLIGRPAAPLAGAIVSAAGVHSALREQRAKVAAARVLGRVAPGLRLRSGIDPDTLSRDPAVVAAYRADPLVHDRASAGFGLDALSAIDRILATPANAAVPLLVLHGGEDRLAYASGSRAYAAAAPEVCALRVYEGLAHEIHNEPEQAQVFADVRAWIDATLSSAAPT